MKCEIKKYSDTFIFHIRASNFILLNHVLSSSSQDNTTQLKTTHCNAKQHVAQLNVTQFKEGENKATQINVKKVLSLFLLPFLPRRYHFK